MRLKTLADVRKLIGRMPMDFRTKENVAAHRRAGG